MVLVATQVKRRRGTTAENDAFTGAEGEITVDTEKHELRVHDGLTQGGFKVGSGTGALIIGQILEVVGTADYTPVGCLLADGAEYTKAQFPDLWADFLTGTPKLQTCTYTEYANQIAEYGFCNKFAVDTTNETFKVPTRNKYRKLVKKIVNGTTWANLYDDGWVEQGGWFLGTASNVAKPITLPIEMTDTNYSGYGLSLCNNATDTGNATSSRTTFIPTSTTRITLSQTAGWRTNWQVNGYTTIPDSTSNITREFVVVANGTLNQEQMDWSAWASSLAGRAKTDMDNITSTGKETVVSWGMPDYASAVSRSVNVDYSETSNGYLVVSVRTTSGDGVFIIKIGNTTYNFFQGYTGTDYSHPSVGFIPLGKGISYKIMTMGNTLSAVFIPCIGG